ncbi:MAG: dihydroorotase [Gammaproteobacteria bacterium]|nr:dihydroorotase [Gammaproteobacteria bacterium]MCW8911180.1 dihydroorotase [Gammaproteobacteria bacterium]MCW9004158.1 dihydroorotase [Gammaproteobacteria bacterium]MCW9055505.1 dihydroorotase [Gammaproteobacteria bacterium]
MSRLVIKNGRVIDPANNIDQITNVYISNGIIHSVGDTAENFQPDQTIDATNHYVIPGIVDLSARLREPGLEYKADIASETVAATTAGITTLCIPPDTDPVIDEPAVVELIHRKVKNTGHANVVALGALTAGLRGEHLSEMAALKSAGCVGLSNARFPVLNSLILRRAFEYAATHAMTVFIEADDHWLSNKGCAHEGAVSTRLGLPPIPYSAETSSIAHYLELIAETEVTAHFCRLSSARSVELIQQAKNMGLKVTADVAAHQLHLTEMDISSFNSQCHVLPPLRNQRDRDALRTGIIHNILSVICSDHQPHEIDAKQAPFPSTEPGISALETLLPLTLRLVDDGYLDLNTAISKLTCEPAKILGINKGTLSQTSPADICIINPDSEWTLDANKLNSRGKNTPFHGWNFNGKVSHTLMNGEIIYSDI